VSPRAIISVSIRASLKQLAVLQTHVKHSVSGNSVTNRDKSRCLIWNVSQRCALRHSSLYTKTEALPGIVTVIIYSGIRLQSSSSNKNSSNPEIRNRSPLRMKYILLVMVARWHTRSRSQPSCVVLSLCQCFCFFHNGGLTHLPWYCSLWLCAPKLCFYLTGSLSSPWSTVVLYRLGWLFHPGHALLNRTLVSL
jgi:hypothetical protein